MTDPARPDALDTGFIRRETVQRRDKTTQDRTSLGCRRPARNASGSKKAARSAAPASAILDLPVRQRVAVVLLYREQLSRTAIAEVLETPIVSVEAKGAAVAVDFGRARDEIPLPRKEPEMSSSLKIVPVAAVVSVFVSIGTVAVYNSVDSVDIDEAATVEKNTAPKLLHMTREIADLREELAAARDVIRELQRSGPEAAKKIQTRLAAVEEKVESAALASAAGTESAATSSDPDEILEGAEELFASLKKTGAAAYASPKLAELADKLGQLEDGGRAFVLDRLSSEDPDERFVAAALAERLKNPELIDDLESAAIEDENFMVRRMSSHALAFMNDEEAVDSLVKIIDKETRDPGVAVNAWFGLASLGSPHAVSTFERVLDRAGGDVPADLVVGTALKNKNPALLPALRLAYDKEAVSSAMKANILRTLAKAESGEYQDFVRQVANDASAAEELRKAAQASLDEN